MYIQGLLAIKQTNKPFCALLAADAGCYKHISVG